jgi:hypothetical protein
MSGDISTAKEKLPLPAVMHQLGLGEHAKRSARCPFHEDQHNSFSVWKNGDGLWFWKCHAGCGDGDEITFLEKHSSISKKEATKLFLQMAGVNGTTSAKASVAVRPVINREEVKPYNSPTASPASFDWRSCVEAFNEALIEELSKWRGYSIEFCRWLKERGLVGLFNDCIAFPVHDRAGSVVAVHYRLKDGSWRYYPQGAKIGPLVIGELVPSKSIHVFESQWDAFAYMDAVETRSGIIITRGASNGPLVSDLLPEDSTVYLWTQRDAAGAKWQKDICAKTSARVMRVKIPEPHKDLNDWTRAGTPRRDLLRVFFRAEAIREAGTLNTEATTSSGIAQPQAFPLHCLPPVCQAMACAVCKTLRVLGSLPGCCILAVVSAAIGRGLQVKSGPNRVTRGNLYNLTSADSGSGKSETFRHTAKPFLDFEAERIANWKAEIKPGLLAERKVLEAEIAKLTKSAGNANGSSEREEIRAELKEKLAALDHVEAKLRAPALSCEDVTGEKLAVLLAHDGEQLASLSPDAVAIVDILLGRYNKLDRTDEGIYLKAFSGDRCKVDRQSREPVLLESPCLTALWLTQPDKLQSLLAERSLSDGGLIPRILACHTHCEGQEIVKDAPEIPTSVEKAYADLIRSLIETYRLADQPFTIEPTIEALETLNTHHNAIVKRRRSELHDVNIYAARWNEQAWRIAVVLHAALNGARAQDQELELDTANAAIEVADWFAAQQLEILSGSRDKARREKWDRVLALADENPEGIWATHLYRARIVCNADEAHALLKKMEAAGELSGRNEQPEGGGHVTRIFVRAR